MTTRIIRDEYDRKTFYDVPDLEDFYQVNLTGEVRSKPRWANSPICGGSRLIPARDISVRLVKGYPAFIAFVEGRKRTVYIHRVLALLFIPNPHAKPSINHIDGDKANFELENLEWCTHLENMRHAYETGLAKARPVGPGEASPASKLNDHKVREIKRRLMNGDTHQSLAQEFGVAKGTIGFIARGETWSHIEVAS